MIVTIGRGGTCTLARMLSEHQDTPLRLAEPPGSRPSLVLVAGSGRSGTSLFSGILQRLGYAVAQPEVPADETNPRGFAESQWVVDFHTRLLRDVGVQVADARPGAWALTAEAGMREDTRGELRDWLEARLSETPALLVKDPRLSWFLPLWRACAHELGADPALVTMLRHPAAVIGSKQRWYRGWQGDVGRLAGWINQTVYLERATRGSQRSFVRYEDLLEDWTRAIGRAGEQLDLAVIRDATPAAIRRAHEYVDRGLRRSPADWDGFAIPLPLREQADEVWALVQRLAHDDAGAGVHARLDALRAAYGELYTGAEAIAQSS
ncbi:MAG: sulfotransferase family protein, partial [Solirubrobacteraceae bacterium]